MSPQLSMEMLTAHTIVPVVVLHDAAHANGLAEALAGGGLPIAEVTFRTDAAAESISVMASRGDITVGAGTVISPEQVDIAADSGAQFIVSPGLLPSVVERALEKNLLFIPGAVTPGEIMQALSLGLDVVKFFPASTFGGPAALKALSAPFPQLGFIPTGGINENTVGEYLAVPSVRAVGGSWMVPSDRVADGDVEGIRALVSSAVAAVNAR